MSYIITKKENQDKDYCGYNTIYKIKCQFVKQSCVLEIGYDFDYPKRINVQSMTDGYHWLEYFLCQHPNCKEMLEMDSHAQRFAIESMFLDYGIKFNSIGKDNCGLEFNGDVTDDNIETVAKILYDRFANRERFFN